VTRPARRKQGRAARPPRETVPVATTRDLVVTVASFSTGDPLDFSRELELTKAALLYADRVTLVGPKVTFLSYVDRLTSGSQQERDQLFLRMLRAFPEGAVALRKLDDLSARGASVRREVQIVKGQLLARARPEVEAALKPVMQQTRYEEFERAIRAGVLALDPLTPDGRPASMQVIGDALASTIVAATRKASERVPTDRILDRFLERLISILLGNEESLPLFDNTVTNLAKSLVEVLHHMRLVPQPVGVEPALATGLIESLPTFPEAPMDEILGAREALQPALARFRATIASASGTVQMDALDDRLGAEVATLYRRDVAPALQELLELQSDLKLGHQVARHAAQSGKDITRVVLGLILATAIDVDGLVRALIALTPSAADIAARVIAERREIELKRRANRFLFLYDVGRRLT
jgi:hypothetical protein